MSSTAVDLSGRVFGNLVVVQRSANRKTKVIWECLCKCGNTAMVISGSLLNGTTRSCGCLRIAARTTHGMSKSPEYSSWLNMISRCTQPSCRQRSRYGGRGITMDPQWATFEQFYSDMGPIPGPRYSIDRINNDDGYFPWNCKWSTRREQDENRSDTHWVEVDGVRMCLTRAAEQYGLDPTVVSQRIRRGWNDKRALETPLKVYRPRTPHA